MNRETHTPATNGSNHAAPPHASPALPHEVMPEGEEHPPPGTRIMAVVRWALVFLMLFAALAAWARYTNAFADLGHDAAAHGTLYVCPMHPSVTSDGPDECSICGMDLVPQVTEKASLYVCPMHPTVTSDGPDECSICGMDLVEQATTTAHAHAPLYVCPMHPTVTSDGPDECSICGMDLVEQKPSEIGHGGMTSNVPGLVPIELSADRLQLIGMKTGTIERGRLTDHVRAVGSVSVDEKRVSVVHARFAGWIERLEARETGAFVRKGQLLATAYSPELLAAQHELVPLLAGAHADGRLVREARQKLLLLGMPPGDVDTFLRTHKPIRAVHLRAPSNGQVTRKAAFDGSYFQHGTQLFEIVDLSSVWVVAEVYESALARIEVGQPATLVLSAYPGRTFEGAVEFVYPVLDPSTRTLRVRLRFENEKLALRPGLFGDVTLAIGGEETLVAPREAIVDTGEHQYAFVVRGPGRFEPRLVERGLASGDRVEVLDGLSEGDVVVTTANFLIDSESRLRATFDAALAKAARKAAGDAADHSHH